MANDRAALVRDLIENRRSPRDVLEDLAGFGWDCDEPLVTVEAEHVRQVLQSFLNDDLGSQNVELWADAIEVRDDLDFASDEVKEAVHVLANPALEGPLNRGRAVELRDSLWSLP